ncbi:ankyrin repeat-containing domain protein [Daldinia eschscholtzii]|nr:ankyrin repeat-containing domain protein [Daldinia eschscholtzii]
MTYSRDIQHWSHDDWERRKARICDLFEENPLKGTGGVIDIMAKEGFPATFRIWGVRKYKKRDRREETNVETQQRETTEMRETFQSEERTLPTAIGITANPMSVDTETGDFASSHNMRPPMLLNEDSDAADRDLIMIDSSEDNFPLHRSNNPFSSSTLYSHNIFYPVSATTRQFLLSPLPSTQLAITVVEISTSEDLTYLLPVLRKLYSADVFAGEDWTRFRDLPVELGLEARFDGRLIASIVNGYAGLGAHLLLNMMLDCLDAQPSPVAKSFTENIFLPCLEADNVYAIKYLLDRKWKDTYTPLQTAAIKQSFRFLRLLVDRGVDTNKSFSRVHQFNALHLLIRHLDDPRSTLDDNLLSLVEALLEAKATISMNTIRLSLEQFADPRLAICLIENVASETPHKLISEKDMLRDIVKSLDEQCATSIIEFIIRKCQDLGSPRYLYRFPLHVDSALDEAVTHGYDELCPSYSLDDTNIFDVSAALDAALAHESDDFDNIAWKLLDVGITTRAPYFRDSRPAPLLYVAVKNNRPDFVRIIIESGLDPNIYRGTSDKWPILETALECDENSIFDEIWSAYPRPIYPQNRPLKLALEKRGEKIFLEIVDASPQGYDTWKNIAMQIAMECENESLLDKLISRGASADDDGFLKEAIENHHSMIIPLLDRYKKAFPDGRPGYGAHLVRCALNDYSTTPEFLDAVFAWNLVSQNAIFQACADQGSLLSKAIRTHDCGIVKKFIDAGSNINGIMKQDRWSNDGYTRTTPLLTAIETEIVEMVQLLIDHAVEVNNMPIVRLLLGHDADINALPSRFGGATALQFAAIQGNCEMEKVLIEHGAENYITRSAGRHGRMPLEGAAENGRGAIRRAESNGHFGCKEKIEEFMKSSARNRIALPTLC